jgi:hypothetical protein
MDAPKITIAQLENLLCHAKTATDNEDYLLVHICTGLNGNSEVDFEQPTKLPGNSTLYRFPTE